MHKTFRVLICAVLLGFTHSLQAQNIGNTPYSRYGLGELNTNLGTIRNAGMAGVGISAANSFQPNTANPALLYYNSITVFDVGIGGQFKSLSDGNTSQLDGNANINLLTIGVPLSKRWSTALSLRPYSSVDYQINTVAPLVSNPNATVNEQYSGEGGISELYFGHGFRIVNGLTIGASASYLFGTIAKESSSLVRDETLSGINEERVVYSERTRYSGLLFRGGANYRQKLKDKLFVSAAGLYSLEADLNAKQKSSYERRTVYESVLAENILPDSSETTLQLPASLRAGISIDNGSNLTVGAEFHSQQWSQFRSYSGEQELADSYRVALGGEYTPNATSVNNYFARVTYRGGLYYSNTQYQIGNEQVKDKGATIGFSFPIGRSSLYEMYNLNTSFAFGNRGTTDNGLISENYLQFNVGFTVNSRWFIKRRIE
ncbi:hypothetical protein [Pontibacter harenae]|uniref:hypothetical protein n=1 Tax=Pontibacter harenae TaxID=2894083 RepID=UPI001E4DAF43|nr:hypothetical protein [Pontibacter harenae]MCC9165328.1 hypothetical protein [Pontibacter harenae]